MATGEQRQNAFKLIQSHIKDLEKDLTTIDERQKLLIKQKQSVEEDIFQKLDSLVDEVKKCHGKASKHLEEAYKEKSRKLEDAKKSLKERKAKAETDLIVDHNPVKIPDIGEFSYTISVDKAMLSIEEIKPKRNNNEPIIALGWKVKLEKPDVASTSLEKRKVEATTPASRPTCAAHSEDGPLSAKKPKVEKTSKRTIQTLRDFVKCTKCRKPRCVYSDQGLKKDEDKLWDVVKNSLRYKCGGSLFSPIDELLNVEPVSCSELVHWHCFSRKARERRFPAFCYNCGQEMDASAANSQETEDHDVSPVCSVCSAAGIGPRVRKRRQRSTKPTDPKIVIDDEDDGW